VFVNGNWLLDPANPLQMWGGFGPNSELRMPTYSYPHETIHRPNIDHGSLSNNILITSSNLGYDVNVRVYTPADYDTNSAELPAVYFTDGHEYAAEHLGSAVQVLDNLIADGRLRPTVAVFVDPRDVASGANRRAEQYITNRNFARFVADELVDYIDDSYSTSDSAEDRTILGTSLGGLNSAYFGIVERDVFQNLAIQSPAFGFDTGIFAAYENGALADDVRIFMTNGTINDGSGAFAFREILTAGNYDFTFTTANEGHSWGNWRAQLDDMLIELVGAPVPEPTGVTFSILGLLFLFRRQALAG
jgi:enterochelin esterase family protein